MNHIKYVLKKDYIIYSRYPKGKQQVPLVGGIARDGRCVLVQ